MSRSLRLRAMLQKLVPVDAAEAEYRAQLLAHVDSAGDAFDRERFTPGHVTASVFLTRGDELFLIHHKKLERWLQPGGHVEPEDEDITDAAARELLEEVGVTAVIAPELFDVDVHEIPARKSDPAHLHLDARFHVELPAGQAARGTDEVNDGRFFSLDAIAALETDESVLRAVRKLRRA